jgi:hypothetical protein
MTRYSISTRIAGLATAMFAAVAFCGTPAFADVLSNLTITASPTFTTSLSPLDHIGSQCTGAASSTVACSETNDLRLDYGLDYRFSKDWGFAYQHNNVDFTLSAPIFVPGGAGVPIGDQQDRQDTLQLNYTAMAKLGLTLNGGYLNKSRSFNANSAQVGPAPGVAATEPAGETFGQNAFRYHGYFVGGDYNLGPHSPAGSLLTLNFRVLYGIHPDTPANEFSNDTAFVAPGVGFVQTVAYGGNRFVPTGGLTLHVPVGFRQGFFPFVGFQKGADYFFTDPGPEYYNIVVAGVAKVITKDLSLVGTYVNLNEQRQPYPLVFPVPGAFGVDYVRLTNIQLTLNYKIHG